jgi:hypothetical protein
MSLISQLFRQKIGNQCPPDLEGKLVFDYLFPELWSVMDMPPWNLQQDICLLRKDENGIGIIENDPARTTARLDFDRSVWTEYHKQCDWTPIQILNHLRSVECPILYTCTMPPFDEGNVDYVEIREMTVEDVRKRGFGSFEATKEQDKNILSDKLDEIIFTMDEIPGVTNPVIKLFPKLNSTARISIDFD